MTKVINLITQMEAGGAQGAAVRMSEAMRLRKIDSETWFIYKKVGTYANEDKVLIVHDSAPNSIIHVIKIIYNLYRLFKKNRPEGVIAYTHYACTLGHIASRLAGVKNRVATLRNPVWTFPKAVRILDELMGTFGFYTQIIAVSETVEKSCDQYPSAYRKRIEVVYNGVPARVSTLTQIEARIKFNLNYPNIKLLVNVGRLHPQKNQKILLSMMEHLDDNFHLAIAGDGELKDELIQTITELGLASRVHLIGEVPPNEIPDFLKCGEIFLFPSIFEAFGFAIFEAAHNGLPIIASNIPSNVEVLLTKQGKHAGIIVEKMEPVLWAEAVKALGDPMIYDTYKENVMLKSKEFNFTKMVDSYVQHSTTY